MIIISYKKQNLWTRHALDEIQLTQRISICDSFLKRNESDPFLKRLITSDEVLLVYNFDSSWMEEVQKMIILLIWWDYKGILYFELLPETNTITSDMYVDRIAKLNNAVQEKRPELVNRKGVVFQHDTEKLHTSLVVRQKLLKLDWEVLSHVPYSPDLGPTNYHLFHPLQDSLHDRCFNMFADLESHLDQFFAGKPREFYKHGIMTLPERWQMVIEKDGQYLAE